MNSRRLKLLLAMVGTGAVFASGLTLAYAETHSATGAPAVAAPQLTTGETSTKSTAPSTPETSVAVPPITTAPYTIPTGEPQ
ncbi:MULTISPECIES: hypothetical protein [unclassified Mycobacterium]|uniref:hypothetical protein n=1 Tax=unclassified Mycobacterium TaxID=2642494 RepID=UPI000800A169|nr:MULTISPECIES: hypothetical protein [unclassified Mycobacterium]OBB48175.1 hypothetical protein A5752_22450 [Mycobacterium sp. 852002-51961_SCH5331710]OBH00031.1 hypothetical protein A5698_09550 [Mycobacterium sp. E136]